MTSVGKWAEKAGEALIAESDGAMDRQEDAVVAGDKHAGASESTSAVNLVDASVELQGNVILEGVDLTIRRGEIVALIGPSGCGKTTLLNVVAGMIRLSRGTATCFGDPLTGRLNKRVTYMTQRDTLLPWRKGIDNAALPLEIKGVPRKERHERALEAMASVGVSDAAERRPGQLSGGMRSRLSLARALLSEADILLMDEPFAAVDALRRVRLQQLLIEIWERTRRTLMYVTHDLNEAVALGHRVIVMGTQPGRIVLEREIPIPHPRDVARVREHPEAAGLYANLWDALEAESNTRAVGRDRM